jgi:hypothetical protein
VVRLVEVQFRGQRHRARVRHASGVELSFDLAARPGEPGEELRLHLDGAQVYALPYSPTVATRGL